MYKIDKEKIRKIMKDKGIANQNELAKKIGITKNQLSQILSKDYDFLKSNIREVCNTLGVDIFDIVSEELSLFSLENLPKEEKKLEEEVDILKVNPSKSYNVVEFFAGAGGLALGLEEAGFDTVLLNEIDKDAVNTLRRNRENWNVVQEDICSVVEKGVASYFSNPNIEVDLISGGYPCQAFSYAGKGLGLEDARGTLFYPFAKAIEELKPKMFLAENVKGLVSHDKGKTLKVMIDVYEKLGYSVSYKVLNALNYGVAQKRERIVIVGIRKDLKEKYNLEYKFPKEFDKTYTLKDILQNVPPSECPSYSEAKRKVLSLVPPGG